MNVQAMLNIEVKPPVEYAIGVAMLITAMCLVIKATMQARSELGWERRSRRTRVLQCGVAGFFIVRGLTIFDGNPVNFMAILLSLSMMLLQLNDIVEYVRRSRRMSAANAALERLHTQPAPGVQTAA